MVRRYRAFPAGRQGDLGWTFKGIEDGQKRPRDTRLRRRHQAGRRLRERSTRAKAAEQGRPQADLPRKRLRQRRQSRVSSHWPGSGSRRTRRRPSAHVGFEFNQGNTPVPAARSTASSQRTAATCSSSTTSRAVPPPPDPHTEAMGHRRERHVRGRQSVVPPCWGPARST